MLSCANHITASLVVAIELFNGTEFMLLERFAIRYEIGLIYLKMYRCFSKIFRNSPEYFPQPSYYALLC